MNRVDVRDTLRDIIEERGYVHKKIAEKACLTPSKLSAILNKNRKLEVGEMLMLCEAIHITPEELLGRQKAG